MTFVCFFFANFSSLLMSVFIFFLPLSVVSWRFSFLHFRIINWVFPRFDGGLFFFNISVLNRCLSYCLLSFACFFQYFRIINWSFPLFDGLFYVICLSLPLNVVSWRFAFLHFRIKNWIFSRLDVFIDDDFFSFGAFSPSLSV